MKKTLLLIIGLFLANFHYAQTGSLQGKVIDKDDKSPLPFVNITIELDGIQYGASSDFDGKYVVKNIKPGKYTLRASFVGYKSFQINNVIISSEKITFVDIQLESSVVLLEVVEVVEYHIPLVDYGKTTSGEIYVFEEMPSTPMKMVAKCSKGTTSRDGEVGSVRNKGISDTVDYDRSLINRLTAGELNDYTKWVMWNDISTNELSKYARSWNLLPKFRYCLQISNKYDNPVVNATVQLIDPNKTVIFETKTDNTGKAEMWSQLFKINDSIVEDYSIKIEYKKKSYTIKNAKTFDRGINFIKLPVDCKYSDNIDIMFVVDATGSMEDEIKYLQAELLDIINNVKQIDNKLIVRLGSLFYRDIGDEYVTRKSDFSTNIQQTMKFISEQKADGGGDYEEAVDIALNEAINNCNWSKEARTKILFLILDAPPHKNKDVIKNFENIILAATKKGIRIIPIMGSGVDKSTEYLFRSLALTTNGTYVFLTDDSGIGDSHIKPTTDTYKVELLNDLIIRLLKQFIMIPECKKPIEFIPDELIPDTMFLVSQISSTYDTNSVINSNNPTLIDEKPSWKIFPNPTDGEITVEIIGNIIDLFVTDNSGKILERIIVEPSQNTFNIDLRKFPNGMYFIRYFYAKEFSVVGKVILNR